MAITFDPGVQIGCSLLRWNQWSTIYKDRGSFWIFERVFSNGSSITPYKLCARRAKTTCSTNTPTTSPNKGTSTTKNERKNQESNAGTATTQGLARGSPIPTVAKAYNTTNSRELTKPAPIPAHERYFAWLAQDLDHKHQDRNPRTRRTNNGKNSGTKLGKKNSNTKHQYNQRHDRKNNVTRRKTTTSTRAVTPCEKEKKKQQQQQRTTAR